MNIFSKIKAELDLLFVVTIRDQDGFGVEQDKMYFRTYQVNDAIKKVMDSIEDNGPTFTLTNDDEKNFQMFLNLISGLRITKTQLQAAVQHLEQRVYFGERYCSGYAPCNTCPLNKK